MGALVCCPHVWAAWWVWLSPAVPVFINQAALGGPPECLGRPSLSEGRSPCILRRPPPSSAVGQAPAQGPPGGLRLDAGCWGHGEASSLSAGAPAVLSGVIVTQGLDTAAVGVSCACRRHGHGCDLGHDTEVMAVSLGHGRGLWVQTPGSWPWAVGVHPWVICDFGLDTEFVAVTLGHGRGPWVWTGVVAVGHGRGPWVCTPGSSVTVGVDTGVVAVGCGCGHRGRGRDPGCAPWGCL